MESALIFSQTVFYFIFSLLAVIVGVLLVIFIYYLLSLTRNLRDISKNLRDASEKTINAFYKIPIISLFLGKKNKEYKKGRNKSPHLF
ncbi:MAG: hypothetical protein HYW34_00890 [Candidatus Brennerbacteria bacterium]|nr:hypothetical protein [Candidatus Brennerbacteria bacterium]